MSAAAIVASMAMIPASAAGTKLNASDDLAKIGRQTQDDLFAVFFNGDESDGAVNKDAISDLGATIAAADIPARILEIFIVNLLHMNIIL